MEGYSSSALSLDEMVENLHNLSRSELRRLAAEALLISDGPDAPHEIFEQDPGSAVEVYLVGVNNTGARVQFDVTIDNL